MNPEYKPVYRQAVDLQHKVSNMLDQPQDAKALGLRNEVQRLVDEMEASTNPRSLENRIKTIQNQLMQIRANAEQVMSPEHTDYLHRLYEQMRMNVRKLSNY